MPDWLSQIGLTAVLAVLGWLAVSKLISIDKKLDLLMEWRTQMEKNCVTWEDLDKITAPLAARTDDHEKRITVVETTCKQQHVT